MLNRFCLGMQNKQIIVVSTFNVVCFESRIPSSLRGGTTKQSGYYQPFPDCFVPRNDETICAIQLLNRVSSCGTYCYMLLIFYSLTTESTEIHGEIMLYAGFVFLHLTNSVFSCIMMTKQNFSVTKNFYYLYYLLFFCSRKWLVLSKIKNMNLIMTKKFNIFFIILFIVLKFYLTLLQLLTFFCVYDILKLKCFLWAVLLHIATLKVFGIISR
jgi:hypothetical protein